MPWRRDFEELVGLEKGGGGERGHSGQLARAAVDVAAVSGQEGSRGV